MKKVDNFLESFTKNLSADQKKWFESVTEAEEYKRDDLILSSGDKNEYVFFITEGEVETSIFSEEGELSYFGRKEAGLMLGEYSAFNEDYVSCDAWAVRPVKTIKCHGSDFIKLIMMSEDSIALFLYHLSSQLKYETQRIHRFYTMEAAKRVEHFLFESVSDDQANIRIPKQESLAAYLGIKRETLSRILSNLKQQNIIEISRHKIHIVDMKALESLVNQK